MERRFEVKSCPSQGMLSSSSLNKKQLRLQTNRSDANLDGRWWRRKITSRGFCGSGLFLFIYFCGFFWVSFQSNKAATNTKTSIASKIMMNAATSRLRLPSSQSKLISQRRRRNSLSKSLSNTTTNPNQHPSKINTAEINQRDCQVLLANHHVQNHYEVLESIVALYPIPGFMVPSSEISPNCNQKRLQFTIVISSGLDHLRSQAKSHSWLSYANRYILNRTYIYEYHHDPSNQNKGTLDSQRQERYVRAILMDYGDDNDGSHNNTDKPLRTMTNTSHSNITMTNQNTSSLMLWNPKSMRNINQSLSLSFPSSIQWDYQISATCYCEVLMDWLFLNPTHYCVFHGRCLPELLQQHAPGRYQWLHPSFGPNHSFFPRYLPQFTSPRKVDFHQDHICIVGYVIRRHYEFLADFISHTDMSVLFSSSNSSSLEQSSQQHPPHSSLLHPPRPLWFHHFGLAGNLNKTAMAPYMSRMHIHNSSLYLSWQYDLYQTCDAIVILTRKQDQYDYFASTGAKTKLSGAIVQGCVYRKLVLLHHELAKDYHQVCQVAISQQQNKKSDMKSINASISPNRNTTGEDPIWYQHGEDYPSFRRGMMDLLNGLTKEKERVRLELE
jgi:hypothetical protein